MNLKIKENGKLFYIRARYGSYKWGSKKSFVRVGKFEDGKLVGSEMYCCSKVYSLVFRNYEDCYNFKKLYNCDDEICELELRDNYKDCEINLKEYSYKNIKCYIIDNIDSRYNLSKIFRYNY